jgi:hypothetical protein
MLKNLVKIAKELDQAGFKKEADIVDVIIRRVASEISGDDESDGNSDVGYGTEEDIEALLEGAEEPLSDEEVEDLNRFQAEEFGEDVDEDELPDDLDVKEWLARQNRR